MNFDISLLKNHDIIRNDGLRLIFYKLENVFKIFTYDPNDYATKEELQFNSWLII